MPVSAKTYPMTSNTTPQSTVHYFTLNDFMNLADQLRTLPELEAYLKARTVFRPEELRSIGGEEDLFSLYLLNVGSFGNCTSKAEARIYLAQHGAELIRIIREKRAAEQYCLLMEKVANYKLAAFTMTSTSSRVMSPRTRVTVVLLKRLMTSPKESTRIWCVLRLRIDGTLHGQTGRKAQMLAHT